MSKKQPIKVAVIGLGRAGYNIHIKRVRDDARYQVTAVTDWAPERIAEVTEDIGCAGYPDHKSLLRDADAEVVVVASASDTHPQITREALRSGRHVVCEKPMAGSARSARSMIDVAEKTGKLLFMHHNRRFSQEFLYLMDVINKSKPVGEVFEIRLRTLTFNRRFDWQTLRKYDGGQLNNAGSHYLDLGLQLLGAPVKQTFCDLKQIASAGDAEDHVKIVLAAENDRTFDVEISTACRIGEPRWTLLGSAGTMICDGSKSQIEYFDPEALPPIKATEGGAPNRRYDNDDVIPWQTREEDVRADSIGDFYDNVWSVLRERGEMVVKPEQTYEVVRTIERCRRISGFYD